MKIVRFYSRLSLILILSVTFVSLAAAQERTTPPSVSVMGEATATARPDQAELQIGVVTQASTAQAAAAQNAKQSDKVIAELRRLLGPNADIKTINYSVSPNYRYPNPREGGQPTITGYTANNTVQVKTTDLSLVSKLIDQSIQSGANNLQSLQFTLKDEQAVRAQALREAAAQAKHKAETIAAALGLKVVRVLAVEESGPVAIPYQTIALQRAEAAQSVPTPVEPGTINVRALVKLTVEVAPR